MAYQTKNKYEEETHEWEPYIPANADKLILGTFPTVEKNRKSYKFFYPNPNNDFWPIIFRIARQDIDQLTNEDPIVIRKRVLDSLSLGIADMGKKVLRQKGSSKDENLFPIEFENIFEILEKNKNIKSIIVTSSSGANSVLSWLHQYCNLNGQDFELPNKKERLPKRAKIIFQERNIDIQIISSPSRQSIIKGEPLFEMYQNAIAGGLG